MVRDQIKIWIFLNYIKVVDTTKTKPGARTKGSYTALEYDIFGDPNYSAALH
jgi:hypothetical protein